MSGGDAIPQAHAHGKSTITCSASSLPEAKALLAAKERVSGILVKSNKAVSQVGIFIPKRGNNGSDVV